MLTPCHESRVICRLMTLAIYTTPPAEERDDYADQRRCNVAAGISIYACNSSSPTMMLRQSFVVGLACKSPRHNANNTKRKVLMTIPSGHAPHEGDLAGADSRCLISLCGAISRPFARKRDYRDHIIDYAADKCGHFRRHILLTMMHTPKYAISMHITNMAPVCILMPCRASPYMPSFRRRGYDAFMRS